MIDIDTIGTIYTPGTFNEFGTPITEPVVQPGYHVNASFVVDEWAAYKVTPTFPYRVFGGIVTHHYVFPDKATFDALLETTNLDPAPKPVVPKTITMRQARLVLSAAGMLPAVKAAVAAAPESVQIEFEYAAELNRDWPTLKAMQGLLGLTDAMVDNLFVQGASL